MPQVEPSKPSLHQKQRPSYTAYQPESNYLEAQNNDYGRSHTHQDFVTQQSLAELGPHAPQTENQEDSRHESNSYEGGSSQSDFPYRENHHSDVISCPDSHHAQSQDDDADTSE